MKDQESEWISVSDLMTSIIAVMVIFIIASLRNTSNVKRELTNMRDTLSHNKNELVKVTREKQRVDSLLESENLAIKQGLQSFVDQVNFNGSHLVRLDSKGTTAIFENGVFEPSKPCLTGPLIENVNLSRNHLLEILQKDDSRVLVIEGYTDTIPYIKAPIREPINCNGRNYFIDNNVDLSVFRAQETRNVLTNKWDDSIKDRVIIAGYGSTKQDRNLGDANRRVTISIVKESLLIK